MALQRIFLIALTIFIVFKENESLQGKPNGQHIVSAVTLKPREEKELTFSQYAIKIRAKILHKKDEVQSVKLSNSDGVRIQSTSPTPMTTESSAHSSVLMVRVLFFLFYCTLGSAMPYIPLFYRRLGIPEDQIGFLGAITPAVTFVVSPLWGALADITGQHKYIMLATFIGSIITRCSLVFGQSMNVYLIGLLVATSAILNAPVKPLMDSAVMSMLTDKSSYGKSRLFGQMGFGFGSYIVGPFLAKKLHYMFIVHALLAIPTAIVMAMFTPKAPEAREHNDLLKGLKHAMSDPKIFVFFTMIFVIGISSGITENFAYVRLAEVGAVGSVLGICRLVSSLAGCPFFWISGQILSIVGVNGVLSLSVLSYVIRLYIYAAIRTPWQALPAEILRGLTFATFWASSTFYVYQASPKGLTATMLGLLNAVYGGIGQSAGSLIGGSLSKSMGIANAFYMCAAVDSVILALFSLYRIVFYSPPRIPKKMTSTSTISSTSTSSS
eukprot:gene2709-5331_t